MGYLILGAIVLSALFPGGRDNAFQPYAGYDDLTLDQASEHVSWGVPLDGGPVHALFVAPRFNLRDVVELSQRLDLRTGTVPLWDTRRVGAPEGAPAVPGTSAQETLQRLNERLAETWDVIVLGNFEMALLPEEQLKAILAKVESGTGLVLANFRGGSLPPALEEFLNTIEAQDAASITRGIGGSLTPEWESGFDFLTAGKHGEGRVVLLDYPTGRPSSHFLLPALAHPMEAEAEYVEAYYSLVAKACLWASKRETGIWVERVEMQTAGGPREEEIPPIFPEEYVKRMQAGARVPDLLPYRVVFNKPAEKNYTVRVQARQPGRDRKVVYTTYETDIPVKKGQQTYSLNLPLGPGAHYLDFWLLDQNRVVDWHTSVLEVQGWPSIDGLTLNKDSLLPNDTLGMAFTIPPPMHEELARDRNCIVFARAVDSLQRIVTMATREVPWQTTQVTLDIDFADLIAPLVKLEVYLLEAPYGLSSPNREPSEFELNRAAFAFRWLPVRKQAAPDGFTFAATGGAAPEYNTRTVYRAMQALGVDTLEASADPSGTFAAMNSGLRVIPRLTSYSDAAVDERLRRVPCLSDPSFLKSEAAALEEAVRSPWVSGAASYSLGNGNCLTATDRNVCHSDTCLQGFRRRAEMDYGTMERLGAAWKTYAADWESLSPLSIDDARVSGVYAPWVDFRQYMDAVFTSAHTMARDVLSVQSPKTRVGFASVAQPGLYSGYSWNQLATELSLLGVPPDTTAVDKVRSYRRDGSSVYLLCGGGYSPLDDTRMRWYPWYAALNGFSGVWYENAMGGSDLVSPDVAIAADGRPLPPFRALAEEMAPLQQGMAALLMRAQRVEASVAVYDSPASRYLNTAETSFAIDSNGAETAATTLLRNAGIAFDFVSSDTEPERLKKYRLLVLPLARALSDAEAETVRQFHAGGGHVIADLAPGACDEHGAPRETPALAELFGVRWKGPSVAKGVSGTVVDAAVEAAGAEAKGNVEGAPVWFEKKDGEALAVLVNQPLSTGDETRQRFAGVLQSMGIGPSVPMEADGNVFHGECFALQYGKATLYGVLRDPAGGDDVEKVEIGLKDGYSFDLRAGMPVVRKKATLRLKRGEAALLGHLPYDVLGLGLTAPDAVVPGRRIPLHLALKTRGGLPGEHVVRVEFGPMPGGPLRHYGKNVVLKNGEGTTYIPLGQHERPGLYRVVAWDIVTSISAEAMVKIVVPEEE